MELQGFYIKEFEACGEGCTPSHVTFEKGFNAVVGKSDTGKTALFDLLDYLLGKSSTTVDLPPEGEKFDTFFAEIHTYDERIFTIMRKHGETNVVVKECELAEYESTNKGVKYGVTANSTVNLSDFLLSLSGVPNIYIKKSDKAKPQKLTYPQIRHVVFINEDKTTSKTIPSLFYDLVYSNWSYYRHILSYLMSGEDDRDFIPNEAPEVKKSRINGRIEYLKNEIKDLEQEKILLEGADDYISMADKAFIDQYKASMSILSRTLDSLVDDLERQQTLSRKLREEKTELGLFVIRLQQLKDNYDKELARLEFINHGASYLNALTKKCPLCGTIIDEGHVLDLDHSKYHTALQQEYADIRFKIKDITNLLALKEKELVEKDKKFFSVTNTIALLNNRIDNIKPDYDKLSQLIKRGEENLSRKLRFEQIGALIEKKKNEIEVSQNQLKEVKNTKKKDPEETYVTDEFLEIVTSVLKSIKFIDDDTKIGFDAKSNDVLVGGRKRSTYGKGNRSILACAMNFALMDYCYEKQRHFSRLLVYDSPLCTKYDTELAENNVLDAFANYCNDKEWNYQVIIFDNKIDSSQKISIEKYPNIHFVEFGTEERPGLFLANDRGEEKEESVSGEMRLFD